MLKTSNTELTMEDREEFAVCSYLAHAGAVVNNKSSNFVVTHFAEMEFVKFCDRC